jgi:hypothetical protein
MEYKAVQFEVFQSPDLGCWKWTVFLHTTTVGGIALTRADAILDAELAIESGLQQRDRRGSCTGAGKCGAG